MPTVFDNPVTAAIDAAIDAEAAQEQPRGHLGMSAIADDARTLWLRFRWSLPDDIPPRTRRIFSLGWALEAEVTKYIRMIPGVELHADDGSSQYGFKTLGGHYAGSMDGVIRGVPGAPKPWHVLEVKSVKANRFAKLEKDGVEKWSPVYFGQMQAYMHHSGMTRALFAAYNKDTSALYFERVNLDPMFGPAMIEKARAIITGPIPESTYPNRDWYEIAKFKGEHYQRVYWSDELPPAPNCRNCRFAVADVDPEKDSAEWGCSKVGEYIPFEFQPKGCDAHNWIPDLVGLPVLDIGPDGVTYAAKNCEPTNAPAHGPTTFNSREFVELSKTNYEFATDSLSVGAREMFGARIESLTPTDPAPF